MKNQNFFKKIKEKDGESLSRKGKTRSNLQGIAWSINHEQAKWEKVKSKTLPVRAGQGLGTQAVPAGLGTH